jgi:RimJ/RimL family protein N-acetyltransferase
MEPIVRKAKPCDAEEISIIHNNAWREGYKGIMPDEFLSSLTVEDRMSMWKEALTSQDKGSYVVSELQGVLQGFSVFGPARDVDISSSSAGELVALNVNPRMWGHGIGSALINYVIKSAVEKEWNVLCLWVIESNSRAINLYKRFGFEKEGVSKVDTSHCGYPITEHRYAKRLC